MVDININQNTMTTMCQGSRLLGMSKSNEHNLESYFRKIVRDNGPEFLVKKLKYLKLDTIRRLEDPKYVMPKDQLSDGIDAPLAWSKKYQRPKGPFSAIYKTWSNPESRLTGVNMLINAIQLDHASEKQIDKFLDGLNTHGEYADKEMLYISPEEARTFVKSTSRSLRKQKLYSGLDLTGVLLPIGNITRSISGPMKNITSKDPTTRHRAIAELSHAYDAQWKSAPRVVTNFIRKNFISFQGVKVHKDTGEVARDYEFRSDLKAWGRHPQDEYAGTVSFLEKPGAKLRSVYNTNRVINYAMTPYANGIVDAFYKRHPHHIFVGRQDKGMEAIQQMIRHGHTLVSADLSSATDRLNFRAFTNGLRGAILSDSSEKAHEPLDDDSIKHYALKGAWQEYSRLHPNTLSKDVRTSLESIDLFERVAEMPFYSKDLESAVALRTGQPLGMMGSFQTLTAMNYCMGREAEVSSTNNYSNEIPQFTVVGDDFVGDSHIMKDYHTIVTSLNGKDNHEKALHSSKYGEFCSHLITKDKIIAFKPKFHLGHDALWLNAEKTTVNRTLHVYRLHKEDKQALMSLAAIGDPILDKMGSISSPQKKPQLERNIINAALQQISMESTQNHDPHIVSRETVVLSRDEAKTDAQFEGTREDFRVYTDTPNGKVYTGYTSQVTDHNNSEQFSEDPMKYDHHKGAHVVKISYRKAALEQRDKGVKATELIRDYEEGKSSTHVLPYHKTSRVSTTEELLQGMNALDATSGFVKRQPYPNALEDHEGRNPVDRSRAIGKTSYDPSLTDLSIKASHSASLNRDDSSQRQTAKDSSCSESSQVKRHSSLPAWFLEKYPDDPEDEDDNDYDSPTL